MLPNWMLQSDSYVPPKDGGTFAMSTIKAIGKAMSKIKIQSGHEKLKHFPALLKLITLVVLIIVVSATQKSFPLLLINAVVLLYLCTWPAIDIWSILKASLTASLIALLLFLPASIMNPSGISNHTTVIIKVFTSVTMLNIFNHTTQWNHITKVLRKLRIPAVFIFTLDITLKYIVLFGKLINDLLTSLSLRSVGKNNKKYTSIGGVMGVTFVRGTEMNKEMYEAMQCRGFTGDYKEL